MGASGGKNMKSPFYGVGEYEYRAVKITGVLYELCGE